MKKAVYVILIIAAIGLAVALFGNQSSQDTVLDKEITPLLENCDTQIDLTDVINFTETSSLFYAILCK